MNWCAGRSRGDSKDEHLHLSDAVLESVMVFRLGAGAVAVGGDILRARHGTEPAGCRPFRKLKKIFLYN